MWISKTIAQRGAGSGSAADMGMTTIGGKNASVMTRGEQRELEIFAPGGLVWQPLAGDTVLVVKGGVGCQEQCVVAAETAGFAPKDMAPGELFLYSTGGASIYLRGDGSIDIKGPVSLEGDLRVRGDVTMTGNTTLTGSVAINGQLTVNGEPYRPCRC